MDYVTLYDGTGSPIAYYEDGEHIFLFSGEAVAYLSNDAVYDYNGYQLGWFKDGWVRDLEGACVYFTDFATGSGPIKPVRKVRPVRHVKRVKPVKSVKHVKKVKPVNKLNWSTLSGIQFFG